MINPDDPLELCTCNGTIALDGAALARALGREHAIPIRSELCRKQADHARTALTAPACTIACTQEAPLFAQLAQAAGGDIALRFVNIRETAGWSVEGAAAGPKIAALLAMAQLPEPEPVAAVPFKSQGQLAIIGPADAAIGWAEQLADTLDVSVLITTTRGADLPQVRRYPVWSGRPKAVLGHLGQFQVAWEPTNPIDLEVCTRCNACIRACPEDAIDFTYQIDPARCTGHRACVQACGAIGAIDFQRPQTLRHERFDLVLDLQAEPLLRLAALPHGYAAPGADPLEQALAAGKLAQLVGEFDKPTYFRFDDKLCAHSRNAITGCSRCLDVCAADAITTVDDGHKIWINPFRCLGCGDCAVTCPTGAITHAYPRVSDLALRVKTALAAYRKAGGTEAVLLLHDAAGSALIGQMARRGRGLPARVLPLQVHSTAAIGLDFVLGAIALGATQVLLLANDAHADAQAALVAQQARVADTVLNALGYGGSHWQVLQADEAAALERALWSLAPAQGVAVAAAFALSTRKRETLDQAIGHLAQHAPQRVSAVPLAAGAPFGTLAIDKSKCTLCKACIGACPAAALADSEEFPRLRFIERNCVQCGLCANTCPEDAITLVPRLLLEPAAREPVTLNEAEPFHCLRCGTAFGTRQMIDVMTGRLGAHSMFVDSPALRRLQMCADCRVLDMMENRNEISIFEVKR